MNIGAPFRMIPPVTKNILIINLIVWAAANLMPATAQAKLFDIAALHYFTSPDFKVWQLFTYMFVQTNFWHLFFNMFAVFMFGGIIESTLNSKRYLFYYISCGLGAALIQMLVFGIMINHYMGYFPEGSYDMIARGDINALNQFLNSVQFEPTADFDVLSKYVASIYQLINTPVIGASGAVFGLLMAFGFMYPKAPLYIMFIPIPVQARWFVIGYAALELFQGVRPSEADNVAHFAHLGGLLVGLLILLYWKHNRTLNVNQY